MKKTPCPHPRVLTDEEKAAGFYIDRYGWTCYRSPNPFRRFLDWSCQYWPVKYITFWSFVSVALFVAGWMIGRAQPLLATAFVAQLLFYVLFSPDRRYHYLRNKYLREHGLPGPYGFGTLDATPRWDGWMDQSRRGRSLRIADPGLPLLLLLADPLQLRGHEAPSGGAAQRGGGASQASGSHYDGRRTERHYDYDDTSDLIYDDDALDDFDRDEDAFDRDDGRDGFDPYDDIDEMTCHMEDPDDPFL